MQEKDQNKKKENKQDKILNDKKYSPMRFGYFPWILLGVIVIYFFYNNQIGDWKRVEISYTGFKQAVKKGVVEEVTIKGNSVKGEFVSGKKQINIGGETFEDAASFKTIKPEIDDPNLIEILEKNNVKIKAKAAEGNWLTGFLILLLPWLVIFGIFFFVNRKMQGQFKKMGGEKGLFGVGKSRARKYQKSKSSITFDNVAGLENSKKELREVVEYLKTPEKFTSLGASIPKGLLLMGAPGTGKTMLARAAAGEAGVPFFSVSGSEFIEMFVGVGASRVRDMFTEAKKESPAIIFIDEIDSIGRRRGTGLGGGHDEREQTLNQILSEMDGFERKESVIVIAATNRPDVLDPALTRPGRFDRQLTLDLPQKEARTNIMKIHSDKKPLSDDVDLESVAGRTVGFSGADLENLVNEAALIAGRAGKKKIEKNDFETALDKIILGTEREERIDENEKETVACHEAGHALVAKMLPETDPLKKVSIIPRGRSLGATQQVPEKDFYNYSRKYLLGRICVALGGRVSERIVNNEITNGAANDLKMVTQLTRKMVCQWGMSDRLGLVSLSDGDDTVFLGRELARQKDYSEYTGRVIDEEVKRIIDDMSTRVEKILKDNREKLDRIIKALIEKETLESSEVDELLEEKPVSRRPS